MDSCAMQTIPAEDDYTPAILIFIQAAIGTVWWFVSWFTYTMNTEGLRTGSVATVPIAWFWSNLGNSFHGYTAATYFTIFMVQMLVSVVEFVTFFFYLFGQNSLFGWWVAFPGWYGAVYAMILTWVFPILQIWLPKRDGGLEGVSTDEYGNNSIVMIILNMTMWISAASIHAIMAPRLGCHIAANPQQMGKTVKKCILKKGEEESD